MAYYVGKVSIVFWFFYVIICQSHMKLCLKRFLVPGSYVAKQYHAGIQYNIRVNNISLIPHPYREALNDKYIVLNNRIKVAGSEEVQTVSFITSRGCPYNCYFCANLNNGSVRFRTKEDMDLEIQYLRHRYPAVGGLIIMDETATISKKHVKNWTQVMMDNSMQYVLSTRGDAIDCEIVSYLATSGCKEIKFGLESGSPKLLRAMNKKLNLEKFEETIYLTKKFGINNKVFLMHGFPGENKETTHETIMFLNKNKKFIDRAVLFQFTPLPGSFVYNTPQKFNIRREFLMTDDFTIYDNMSYCWGTKDDYNEMIEAYIELKRFVELNFKR